MYMCMYVYACTYVYMFERYRPRSNVEYDDFVNTVPPCEETPAVKITIKKTSCRHVKIHLQ